MSKIKKKFASWKSHFIYFFININEKYVNKETKISNIKNILYNNICYY